MAAYLIYPDVPARTNRQYRLTRYADIDASGHWLAHFQNKLQLDRVAKTSPDFDQRRRAETELLICERKLAYWNRHPNWDFQSIQGRVQELTRRPRG